MRIDPVAFDQKVNIYPASKYYYLYVPPTPSSTSTFICVKIKLLFHTQCEFASSKFSKGILSNSEKKLNKTRTSKAITIPINHVLKNY